MQPDAPCLPNLNPRGVSLPRAERRCKGGHLPFLLPSRGDLPAALTWPPVRPGALPQRRQRLLRLAPPRPPRKRKEEAFPRKHMGARRWFRSRRDEARSPRSAGRGLRRRFAVGNEAQGGRQLRTVWGSSGRFPASSPLPQSSCSPTQGGLLPLTVSSRQLAPSGEGHLQGRKTKKRNQKKGFCYAISFFINAHCSSGMTFRRTKGPWAWQKEVPWSSADIATQGEKMSPQHWWLLEQEGTGTGCQRQRSKQGGK